MSFIDKITVKKQGNDNTPLGMAKRNIEQMDAKIQDYFVELGSKVYENSSSGVAKYPEFEGLLNQITQCKLNRESYFENWLQLQGLMLCKSCYKQIPFGSVFCSFCGQKATEKNDAVYKESIPNILICPVCKMECEKDSVFCSSCGNRL